MAIRKTVFIIGDGMADYPLDKLDGKTPLQCADCPSMDSIAAAGCSGTLLTLPEGVPASSDTANMSVMGCDLEKEYFGRGPMEAAGMGIDLGPDDVAFRLNLVTVEDGVFRDFTGGRPDQKTTVEAIAFLNDRLGSDEVRLYPGVSYRNIMVLSGPRFSEKVHLDKPYGLDVRVAKHLPRALVPGAEATAELLLKLMDEAAAVLPDAPFASKLANEGKLPINGIWPGSCGRAGKFRTLQERCGITGAVISAVDVIIGMGRLLGMEVVKVPGATGYIDTNYEGKADAALDALQRHDLVYTHVEGIDEVSHDGDCMLKVKTIEEFDRRLVGRILAGIDQDVNIALLPDHYTPCSLGEHSRDPVPVSVRRVGVEPDPVTVYNEPVCAMGALGAMTGSDLIDLMLG